MSDDVEKLLARAWSLRELEQWGEMLAIAQQARSAAEETGFTPRGRPVVCGDRVCPLHSGRSPNCAQRMHGGSATRTS
jgi:hypothetical protein